MNADTRFAFDFDEPRVWPAFLAQIEQAVNAGFVTASGDARDRRLARTLVDRERQAERDAFEASERARIDAEKSQWCRQRFAGAFG